MNLSEILRDQNNSYRSVQLFDGDVLTNGQDVERTFERDTGRFSGVKKNVWN